MTPQEALEVIDNVLAQVQLPRQGHAQLQEAVMTLAKAINPVMSLQDAVDQAVDKGR